MKLVLSEKGDSRIKFVKNKDVICLVSKTGQMFDSHAFFPIGMAMISASLKQAGYKVKVLDLDVYPEFDKEIINYNFIMLGLSAGSALKFSLDKIEELKSNNDKIVILGGPLVMAMPQKVMKETKADFLVHGDAEKPIVELMEYLEGKRKLDKIMGLGFRKNGEIIINPKSMIEDLDSLPFPDTDSFNMEKYAQYVDSDLGEKSINWYTSRGCVFDCQFCFHEKNFRGQSAERIVRDLRILKEKYGIKGVWFYDDNFMNSVKRIKEFCALVKPLGIKWGCEARVTSINEEMVKLMKDSGCVVIRNGLESGSDRILKVMNKAATVNDIKKAILTLTNMGMPVKGGFMFGVPTEAIEDAKQTSDLIKWIYRTNPKAVLWTYFFTPRPDTPWYYLSVKLGMKDYSLRDWIKLNKYDGLPYNTSNMTEKQVRKIMRRIQYYAFFANSHKAKIFFRYILKRENFKNIPSLLSKYFYIRWDDYAVVRFAKYINRNKTVQASESG